MMAASAIGVLKQRSEPNLICNPAVALKTPPLPFTSARFASRLQSATSSPNTMTRGSRRISSRSVLLISSTIVRGSPEKSGSTSNSAEVGSILSEYKKRKAEPLSGGSACNTSSVTCWIS